MIFSFLKNNESILLHTLGKTPPANSFLKQEDIGKKEDSFPLELYFNPQYSLVHLGYVVPPDQLFRNYLYVSSTSATFRRHFLEFAETLKKKFNLHENSLIVDVGSNDGIMIRSCKAVGIQGMGIEPATNLSMQANYEGLETINEFLNEKAVQEVIKRRGHADIVTATNVFAHTEDISYFVTMAKKILKPGGILVIEIQYLFDTIRTMTFDNVYHEHLYYYTLTSLNKFFRSQGMEIIDVEHVDTHGGSLRVYAQKQGAARKITNAVQNLLQEEKEKKVDDIETYKAFALKITTVKTELKNYIKKIKDQHKSIAGYGAPAKSTTLLNYCGITSEEIDYIVDDNPLKMGLYTPGTHISVVSSEKLKTNKPDYLLILAWNFAPEILQKTKFLAEQGTQFIIPLPEPRIV